MYHISNSTQRAAYEAAINATSRKDRVVGTVTFPDTSTYAINDSNIVERSLYINEKCSATGDIDIGCVTASELGLSLKLPENLDPYAFDGALINLAYEIETSVGWVSVPLGKYVVVDTVKTYGGVQIKALDYMILLDKSLATVTTIGAIDDFIAGICARCNVVLATSRTDIWAMANGSKFYGWAGQEKIQTCRDLLMWSCQMLGAFARFNREGRLEIVPVTERSLARSITPSQRYNATVSDNFVNIGKVTMKVGDTEYAVGDGEQVLQLEESPFFALLSGGDIRASLERILDSISSVGYNPSKIDGIGDPRIQAGDLIYVDNGSFETNNYPSVISYLTSVTWRHGGRHELLSEGKGTLVRQDYSQTGKSISQVIKEVENVKEAATNAQLSADGKNNVFYQEEEPPVVGRVEGDTWFKKLSGGGYEIHEFDGAVWKKAELDGQTLKAGTVKAAQIDAGAVTAEKMNVKGLTVTNNNGQTTLKIDENGNLETHGKVNATAFKAQRDSSSTKIMVDSDGFIFKQPSSPDDLITGLVGWLAGGYNSSTGANTIGLHSLGKMNLLSDEDLFMEAAFGEIILKSDEKIKLTAANGTKTLTFPDDFASGSWTPVLTDGYGNPQPTTTASGQWQKTGNAVTIHIMVKCGSGVTGNLRLSGMPPEIYQSSSRYISGMVAPGAGNPNKMLIGGGFGSEGIIYLQKNGGGYLNGEDTASGDLIILSGSYIL